ncbi:MAG: heme exporter protein CcmD [Acetobacteraceae bacterium]|nr:heme exporter protein CcmD [Acetobacteraceae bacterium]
MGALSDMLGMGGYGAYVWPAFILAAVVLAGLLVSSVITLRRREREAQALEAQRQRPPRGTNKSAG